MGNILRVGFIRTSSIGDVVLATVCLEQLARQAQATQVTWIGRQPSLGLLEAAFPEMRCLSFTGSISPELCKAVAGLDILVDLQGSLRSRQLAWFCSTKRVYRYSKPWLRRPQLLWRSYYRGRQPRQRLQLPPVPEYTKMLNVLRKALTEHGWDLEPPPTPHLPLPFIPMSQPPLIAIGLGASHAPKRAPVSLFRDIMAAIEPRPRLVLLGDQATFALGTEFIQGLPGDWQVENLAGKLSLRASADYIQRSVLLLSNDSGLVHIAEALGRPSFVLFGPTHPDLGFAPWQKKSRGYGRELGCRPCSRHGATPCRYGDYACFTDPEIVAADIRTYLS